MGHRKKITLCGSQQSIPLETMVSGPAKCMQHGWEIPALRQPSWPLLTHKSEASVPLCLAVLCPSSLNHLKKKQISKKHMLSLFEKDSLFIRRCYKEGSSLYALEIIIIPLKLQLIALFLLHSGRRVVCWKNTELNSKVEYSRFFSETFTEVVLIQWNPGNFVCKQGLNIRITKLF